ncbi:tetratricopeptide repeat protein [Paludisphaera sp.]|uniref:protein kinase domain-containing protein n=1 Tax=Paludisphaera sp. TaxID=2017432 RepID=UPI00301C173F
MSAGVWGRTWEDASTPSAARLTRRYERAWREADGTGSRPDPRSFLAGWPEPGGFPGARLALLRADMSLRWEAGERTTADDYARRFPELGEDTVVALIYEEFCLLEEAGEPPAADAFLGRYPRFAEPLKRVLDIHNLVGNASTSELGGDSTSLERDDRPRFPEAGDALAGFRLVEELGRGSFARVFLARETQLADRAVALKVSLRGSREPQTLARLQHTHIVPVHSHSVEPATGMHILCMPYFGRVTLGRLLSELARDGADAPTGLDLVAALDRLDPAAGAESGPSPNRRELAARPFARALAWWGARLAEALAHAHERGVLHRDVKPSNVLIAADGTPMLLDFNLAHEEIAPGEPGGGGNLGGTVDYMAPEHLEALADASGDRVDARSDVFSMGVLLYEALLGAKPFEPPSKGASVVESLLDAADARRGDPRALFPPEADLPAPLRAVLLRCLAPDPADRYRSADELAEDLQAVADDLPLAFAREPLWSRVARRARRNRIRFATAALVMISCAAAGAAAINLNIERSGRRAEAEKRLQRGDDLMSKREFDKALVQFEAAVKFAESSPRGLVGRIFDWRNLRDLAERVRVGLAEPDAHSELERQEETAKAKVRLARRSADMREHADRIHRESEGLRMRFIGVVEGRAAAVETLVVLLKPFYVLGPQDWTKLEHNLSMLDAAERARLQAEVDELLFLWIVGVERAIDPMKPGAAEQVAAAVDVCDKALKFAGPGGPWRELRARLLDKTTPGARAARPAEPDPREESSALACFQWGLLHSAARRPERAVRWLRRAVWIEWSNYWYQYYLGYLEDAAGMVDEALGQYNVAVAVKPDSPWVLFSRARLFHKTGEWDKASEDMERALAMLEGRPESVPIRLELGYVHQALGDFRRARARYAEVLDAAPDGPFGRAARLNLANIAAESGDVAAALRGFDDLLATDPDDSAARLSRALLDLRLGRAESASAALDLLLGRERRDGARSDLLATRAVVRMLLGRDDEAVVDALAARRLEPAPARDRLVARALIAAGRVEDLQLDDPDSVDHFPLGGARLRADLVACERRIAETAPEGPEAAYRARLTRAAILSALGRHAEARSIVRDALEDSKGSSAGAHLVASRIARRASDPDEALLLVERGLARDPDDPELLELRGTLRIEAGDVASGMSDLDLATARSDSASAHAARASALRSLGRPEESLREWSRAIRRDPESARAYLGRALCWLDLPEPLHDPALVDLEQAASWARDDAGAEIGVVLAYARCLPERPDRLPRWLAFARRAAVRAWDRAQPWAAALAPIIRAG